NFEVTFRQMGVIPPVDVSKLYEFDPIEDEDPDHQASIAEECDGYIDSINGASPRRSGSFASGLLSVHGWLAKSVAEGALPQTVLLALRDGKGRSMFIKTRQTPRPDVAEHYKKPTLEASGYTSTADVSMLEGNYTLGLAFKEGDRIER